jgi:protein tyrosine phosphatase (PTP) superfamily phosphohydrolase (DUF442 family)
MSELNEILNYLPLSERIGTAGQPTEAQFHEVREAGYRAVINLALPTSAGALRDERRIVESLGMDYVSIPVEWEAPRAEDAFRFFDAMDALRERKTFVHCAMNMRVSAFMYLYRVLRQGEDPEVAERDLLRIWTPNERWRALMEEVREADDSAR